MNSCHWFAFTFLFLENPGNFELDFCWSYVLKTSLDLCSACGRSLSRLCSFPWPCSSGGSLQPELWVGTRNKASKSLNKIILHLNFSSLDLILSFSIAVWVVTLNLWPSAPAHCSPTPWFISNIISPVSLIHFIILAVFLTSANQGSAFLLLVSSSVSCKMDNFPFADNLSGLW